MKRLVSLGILLAAAACGGREIVDVDANIDANYELDAHWGECCDRTKGGLSRPCTSAELEGGSLEQFQCAPFMYCGLYVDPFNPPEVQCCGNKPDHPVIGVSGVDENCPPWPGAVEASWGECCYQAHALDAGPERIGGVLGPCPTDTPYLHVQCSANQYCGLAASDGSAPYQQCCGDRSKDEGTINASGLDPYCMPQYWQL